MVNIPTSRDVGFVSTRSGRIAPSGPSVDVGAALSNVGQAMQQVAYDLNTLRETEAKDNQAKLGYDLETKLTEFRANEEELFNAAKESSSESGIGFTRQHIEGYQKRADEFIKANFGGVNEAQNAAARQSLLGIGNSLYQKASSYETIAKTNFYDRTTNSGLDTIRTSIRNNAAPYEELKRQGLAAIDAADMPEPWKAERRAMWDADAAESKWRWKFEQDPQEAMRAISGVKVDATGLANAIKQTADQLGISPNDLATVMSYETGGTFDPWKKGPTTKWGTHRGLIQWGEPQAAKYGVTADMPIEQQVAAAGQYLIDAGVKPGMGLLDIYSAVNAGGVGLYSRSDAAAGGAPGTVRDKVENQMEGHKAKAAALLGGTFQPSGASDPDLDAIPYERREQLLNEGETAYNQQRTRERAASVDRYRLLIATEPEGVSQDTILSDSRLDDGDKATLITSLKSAVKETGAANALIGALAQGNVAVNAFDEDQRKIANMAYDKILGAAQTPEEQQIVTSDFVARTGYVPQKVQAELRYAASSTDPQMMASAMESAISFSSAAPAGFSFDGAEAIRRKADLYRAYTRNMGYSSEEAARKLIDASDPEKAAARESLLKSDVVSKQIKAIDANAVSAVFDDSFLGFGSNPKLGANPAAEAAMVADYKTIYQEALVDAGGDDAVAKQAASERFRRTYGVSEFSTLGDTVIRYPVEKAYPVGPDGSHDWVRDQAVRALQGEGVKAEEIYLMPLPDGGTEKDIRAGKPARYQILYKNQENGNVEQFNLPFFADPAEAQKQFLMKKNEIRSQSEQRMIEGRTDDIARGQAIDNALASTTGADWMKAKAAETAVEQQRMQQDIEQQRKARGVDASPKIGGGW